MLKIQVKIYEFNTIHIYIIIAIFFFFVFHLTFPCIGTISWFDCLSILWFLFLFKLNICQRWSISCTSTIVVKFWKFIVCRQNIKNYFRTSPNFLLSDLHCLIRCNLNLIPLQWCSLFVSFSFCHGIYPTSFKVII